MRQRRPVNAALRQPPCVPHGGDPAGGRRALGHGADVRTGRDHPGPFAGAGLGQPVGPAAAQGGQRLHVPQPRAPVPGDQGVAHEDRAGLYLYRTSQRVGGYSSAPRLKSAQVVVVVPRGPGVIGQPSLSAA